MAEKLSPDDPVLDLDPIISEAMKRWNICSEWESTFRERFISDLKFANADSENMYQWPNAISHSRDLAQKPCLTINVTRQHNLQIINEGKQGKSQLKCLPTGEGATEASAKVLNEIIRTIEYRSHAQQAYQTAREFQIEGGVGWWRIVTDYVSENSFDQEILIQRISDPLSIYFDPDCKNRDKSDMRYAFVFDTIPKDKFAELYPEYADKVNVAPLGSTTVSEDLVFNDHVKVVEYFRKVKNLDEAVSFIDPDSQERVSVLKSKIPSEIYKVLKKDEKTRVRPTFREEIEWYLIVAQEIVDSTIWPGKYIPLIPLLGEEVILDGILDRKGHTRYAKDAQRMFNYNASGQVEFVSLQSKTPWVAALESIEGLESYWNTANTTNHAILPFKGMDESGNPLPMPQRIAPPTSSPAFQSGMDTAFNQMMMSSGQWQNQMGMMGNERTGAAISKRQAQGDVATFHFFDNFQEALVNTGRQIIDLIPQIMDTTRVLQILGEDGENYELKIDPKAAASYQEKKLENNTGVSRIFNPNIGTYDVQASTGPDFGTKKKETADALTLILTQAPGLTAVIGDLLLSSLEFDKAQEAAQRLKRMVPPAALGQGPTQNEQMLQQQVQSLQAQLSKTMQQTAKDQLKLVGKDQMRDIDVYEAETKRIAALQNALPMDQQALTSLIHQLVGDSLGVHLNSIVEENNAVATPDIAPPTSPVQNPEYEALDPTKHSKKLQFGPLIQGQEIRKI